MGSTLPIESTNPRESEPTMIQDVRPYPDLCQSAGFRIVTMILATGVTIISIAKTIVIPVMILTTTIRGII